MTLCDPFHICDSQIETRRGLRVGPLTLADMPAVSQMTTRCSRDTIYHRFHGHIDLPTYLGSLLASEQTSIFASWRGCCVGLASLGPGARGRELAVLVEDAWQRQGVGVRMLEALVDLARGQGFGLLHADVLSEDVFILGVLARYGRLQVELEYGEYSVAVHIDDGSTSIADTCAQNPVPGRAAEPGADIPSSRARLVRRSRGDPPLPAAEF